MKLKLSLIVGAILCLTASNVSAKEWRWVPHECKLSVPRLHRDQTWGLYVAHGATREEAKQRAVNICKSELEAYHPGKCAEFGADYYRWSCMWEPRWEF